MLMSMNDDFCAKRWADTIKNYEDWWNKKLDRPIVFGWHYDRAKHTRHPGASYPLTQSMMYDENMPFEKILDGCEYEMLTNQYFADSFPYMHTALSGPGALAAYMGARPVVKDGGIWFFPPEDMDEDLSKLDLILDGNNRHYIRMKDYLAAAVGRFGNKALVGMPDIGGNLDILAGYIESGALLLALYDDPDSVKRLTWQAHKAWHRCFSEFGDIVTRPGLGYSNWAFILSQKPFYMLQCDFCYMISNDMFNEFVLLELKETAKKMSRTIYHMDGVAQEKHLDSVLSIAELDGVQWGPGEGKPPVCEWPEVIKKILDADKLLYYNGNMDGVEKLSKIFGKNLSRMYIQLTDAITNDNADDLMRRLDKIGIGF